MTIIRVDPEILKQSANCISDVQNKINRSSQEIINAGNSAPDYEGQFGSKVRSICNDASSRARTLADKQRQLSSSLQSKAQAFATADMASLQGLVLTSKAIKDWQDGPWWLSGWNRNQFMRIYQMEKLLKLGRLFLTGGLPAFTTAYVSQLGLGTMTTGTFFGIKIPWLHIKNAISSQSSGLKLTPAPGPRPEPKPPLAPPPQPPIPPQNPLASTKLFTSDITNLYNQPSIADPMKSGKNQTQITAGQRVEFISDFKILKGCHGFK